MFTKNLTYWIFTSLTACILALSTIPSKGSGQEINPDEFEAGDIYPNPVENSTSMEIDFPAGQNFSVEVYNINGQKIISETAEADAGFYTMHLSLGHIPKGKYLLHVRGTESHTVKMLKTTDENPAADKIIELEERLQHQIDEPEYQAIQNEYLVGFKNQANTNAIENAGGNAKHEFNNFPVIHADLPAQAKQALENNPNVEFIEKNKNWKTLGEADREISTVENDLNSPGPHWNISRIGSQWSWNNATGDGKKVALFDSGIDGDHEALKDNLAENHYAVLGDGDPLVDEYGHGTHVAGIVGAVKEFNGDINEGVGVAHNATLVSVKVINEEDGFASWSDIAEGVDWCIDTDNCDIINMSIGGGYSETLDEALEEAYNDGILTFASAGNSDYDGVISPANYESTIAVAASTIDDDRASFSSVGEEVDIIAPGAGIYSTLPGDDYGYLSGTSMSSPAAAGGAAIIWEHYNNLSNAEIEDSIFHHAEDLGLPSDYQGEGLMRVDHTIGVNQGHIEGTVYDDETNNPIEGAKVFAGIGSIETTNSNGEFLIENIPEGKHFVRSLVDLNNDELMLTKNDISTTENDTTVVNFNADVSDLSVITDEASNKQGASVTLEGTLQDLDNYNEANVFFQWRWQGDNFWEGTTSGQELSSSGEFEETLSDLIADHDYEFRAVAQAGEVMVAGDAKSFTTSGIAPKIDYLDVQNSQSGPWDRYDIDWEVSRDGGGLDEVESQLRDANDNILDSEVTNVSGSSASGLHELRTRDNVDHVKLIVRDNSNNEVTNFDASLDVTTSSASNVDASSAQLSGELDDLDNASDADVYFEWKKQGEVSWQLTNEQNLTSAGSFNETISDLESGTEYTFRAVGIADGTVNRGDVKSFETETDQPVEVATLPATNIDTSSAQLEGEITDLDAADADVHFEWRETGESSWNTTSSQSLSSTGTFNESISSLDQNTEYEFRTIAEADGEIEEGSIETFTTAETSIEVATLSATEIDTSSAQLEGELTELEFIDEADVHFEWRENGASSWNTTSPQSLSSTGTFNESISGLDQNTEYEFRAIAEAGGEDDQGSIHNFATADASIEVATLSATEIDTSSAQLEGELTELEFIDEADVYFEWRENGASSWNSTSSQSLSSTGTFNESISSLDQNTEYEFRAIAEAGGESDQGSIQNFATADASINVETLSATNIDTSSAQLEGELTELEFIDEADVHFEWRENGASSWNTTSPQSLSSTGTFNESISGLDQNTEYEFRAIAEAGGESDQGSIENFATDEVSIDVSTKTASNIDISSAQLEGELTEIEYLNEADVYFEWRENGASNWNSTSSQSQSSTGDFNENISGLSKETEYEYRAVAEGGGKKSYGSKETFTTEGDNDPEIDNASIDNYHSPGPWDRFDVDWQVSHTDGNLDEVTSELKDANGNVLDSETTSVSGFSASGLHEDLETRDNDHYEIKVTVTDTDNNEVSYIINVSHY